MVRAGLDLDGELLALVCASHSGEDVPPRRRARGSWRWRGLDETALQTPPDWPLDDAGAGGRDPAGRAEAAVAMNCSGKHAGMLRDAVATRARPWRPTAIRTTPPSWRSCGASTTSPGEQAGEPGHRRLRGAALRDLAVRAGARVRPARRGAAGSEGLVAAAIREHPEFVSGTRRDELELHRAVPGLVGKAGAESVYAVGLPDGRGVAIKISDGSPRARPVAMAGVLRRLGLDTRSWTLRPARRSSVTGSGWARSARTRTRWPSSATDRGVRCLGLSPVGFSCCMKNRLRAQEASCAPGRCATRGATGVTAGSAGRPDR